MSVKSRSFREKRKAGPKKRDLLMTGRILKLKWLGCWRLAVDGRLSSSAVSYERREKTNGLRVIVLIGFLYEMPNLRRLHLSHSRLEALLQVVEKRFALISGLTSNRRSHTLLAPLPQPTDKESIQLDRSIFFDCFLNETKLIFPSPPSIKKNNNRQ